MEESLSLLRSLLYGASVMVIVGVADDGTKASVWVKVGVDVEVDVVIKDEVGVIVMVSTPVWIGVAVIAATGMDVFVVTGVAAQKTPPKLVWIAT